LINRTTVWADRILNKCGIDESLACIAVVGSVGRREALKASDLDLLPIWSGDEADLPVFDQAMDQLRCILRFELSIDVSTSRDLMRSTQLTELSHAESIGGDKDDRRKLTQRILVLTEASQAGGKFKLLDVRSRILEAYVGNDGTQRTASRHPLAVCNDIARYFRTVCLDYKSRAETKPENWCLRNTKLRGARKFWYFSTLFAISSIISEVRTTDQENVAGAIVRILGDSPVIRLFRASAGDVKTAVGRILVEYAEYLRELGDNSVRNTLNSVEFETRFREQLPNGTINPFPSIYASSKKMHQEMIEVLGCSDPNIRRKVLDWFLL